jgi:hypothetical protein
MISFILENSVNNDKSKVDLLSGECMLLAMEMLTREMGSTLEVLYRMDPHLLPSSLLLLLLRLEKLSMRTLSSPTVEEILLVLNEGEEATPFLWHDK